MDCWAAQVASALIHLARACPKNSDLEPWSQPLSSTLSKTGQFDEGFDKGCDKGVGLGPPLASHFLTTNERKFYETRNPLPKSVALSQELQTKSCHSNPARAKAHLRFSSHAAIWLETATGT